MNSDPDDGFGHWLAGFIDGEGCFIIAASGRSPHFLLNVRADEIAVMREIVDWTGGLGKLTVRRPSGTLRDGRPRSDMVIWKVVKKDECLALVHLLDRYPLRAKKRHDYSIWRQAVAIWSSMDNRCGTYSERREKWNLIAALRSELIDGRRYVPTAVSPPGHPGAPRRIPEHVVERIRTEHAGGRSAWHIAKALEADEVPTAAGGPWSHKTVATVLTRRR